MFGAVSQVTPRTAKSFEDLSSGFRFRVVGDGRVEQELVDRFQSPGLIEAADDRRLKSFVTQYSQIRNQELTKESTQVELQKAIQQTMGAQWAIEKYQPVGGNQGKSVLRLELTLNEPGAGSQSVRLDTWEKEPTLNISTTVEQSGWTVTHRIDGLQGGSTWTESATCDSEGHQAQELY